MKRTGYLGLLACCALVAAAAGQQPGFRWVNKLPENRAPAVEHGTYFSKSNSAEVGYYVYLPPGYEADENAAKRYPVVYYLHGGRPGGEHKSISLAPTIDAAMRAGRVPPMIYVFVNGGAMSHYDFPARQSYGETALVKELIPHIDATYRTIARREGRGIEGFSQGGRGTARIMFKYPELFCSAAPMGGGHQHEKHAAENGGRETSGIPFEPGNNSYDLARKYAERKEQYPLRILVAVGKQDMNYEANLDWMRHLEALKIPFTQRIAGDAPHSAREVYRVLGDEAMLFHAANFAVAKAAPLPGGRAEARGSGKDERPNIVLILADDLGWADLGCYGNTFNETPSIDRLAREGMRFTQFYAGPVCSPTRANLQSGQDQARFGITQHIPGHRRPYAKLSDPVVTRQLPLEVETFAECLGRAGYATGYFGKWHLGGGGFGPAEQGWQTAIECQGHTVSPVVSGQEEPQRMAQFLTDKAVGFIEANRDRPFLLQVSHAAVHIPLTSTPELVAKYQAKPPMTGYPSRPEYAGLLEELDRSVGAIAAAIDRLGLAERTLILFLSDNGGLVHEQSGRIVTSNKPLRGEKGTLYEGGIRIPAIARWIGNIPQRSTCDRAATTIDIHPTLVDLARASAPPPQPRDGVSLAALLRDPAARLSREALYWHLPHYHHSTPASAIRKGDFKLIEFFEDGAVELYDLGSDVSETSNLASGRPDVAQALQAQLAHWRKHVGAQMPVPNPDYQPERASELGKRQGKAKRANQRPDRRT